MNSQLKDSHLTHVCLFHANCIHGHRTINGNIVVAVDSCQNYCLHAMLVEELLIFTDDNIASDLTATPQLLCLCTHLDEGHRAPIIDTQIA